MLVVPTPKRPSFWPLLSVLQKAGFFPCKKAKDSDTQKLLMKPVNGFIQSLSYMLVTITVQAIQIFGLFLVYSEDKHESFTAFIKKFYKIGSAMEDSEFDSTIMMSLYGFIFITHFAMMSRLVSSKRRLCDVFNYFTETKGIDDKIIKVTKKPFYHHLLKLMVIASGFYAYFLGFSINVIEALDINFTGYIPYLIYTLVSVPWMFAPILAFHLYFLEIALMLHSWILTLKENIKSEVKKTTYLFQECGKVQHGLHMFTEAISQNVFWLFMMNLIMTIVEIYLIVAFFISQDEMTFPNVLLMIGYGGFGGFFIFLTYNYCTFSQLIKDAIDDIK